MGAHPRRAVGCFQLASLMAASPRSGLTASEPLPFAADRASMKAFLGNHPGFSRAVASILARLPGSACNAAVSDRSGSTGSSLGTGAGVSGDRPAALGTGTRTTARRGGRDRRGCDHRRQRRDPRGGPRRRRSPGRRPCPDQGQRRGRARFPGGSFSSIDPEIVIGERASIQARCYVAAGTIVEDDVFIGPGVTRPTTTRWPAIHRGRPLTGRACCEGLPDRRRGR